MLLQSEQQRPRCFPRRFPKATRPSPPRSSGAGPDAPPPPQSKDNGCWAARNLLCSPSVLHGSVTEYSRAFQPSGRAGSLLLCPGRAGPGPGPPAVPPRRRHRTPSRRPAPTTASVTGRGRGSLSGTDQIAFAASERTGDFDVQVRVTDLEISNLHVRAPGPPANGSVDHPANWTPSGPRP